jgi:predicted unusual protein kinase regulating ubiquinone biosynthesis (AarF/ABC1/UbiB family)
MAQNQKPPTRGVRFLKLAGMTASVAGDYTRGRIKRIFLSEDRAAEQAQADMTRVGTRIAETLGELKGAAMKIGQMASMAKDLLPAELSAALQSLQSAAPPVDYAVIEAQILAEFDQPIERLFERFDREPFAAASIGQVHRARVDGREVIVKVQYPGVDGAVDSDMRHLKLALLASGILRVDRRALDASFDEISARMKEELDYCNESDNVRRFRAFHRRHPFVLVPEVIGHRSAKRVLTLSYEAGDAIKDFDARGYSASERDRCGLYLWRAMESQIFDLGALHADPNPANFAFRKDGRVIMYDFGCVKTLEPGVADGCKRLLLAGLREDYAEVDRALRQLDVRRETGPAVAPDFYKIWRDWLALPILAKEVFDFGASNFEREAISKLLPLAMKHMASFHPSRELVFLNRAVLGHYATLRAMRARLPVTSLFCERVPEAAQWLPGQSIPPQLQT